VIDGTTRLHLRRDDEEAIPVHQNAGDGEKDTPHLCAWLCIHDAIHESDEQTIRAELAAENGAMMKLRGMASPTRSAIQHRAVKRSDNIRITNKANPKKPAIATPNTISDKKPMLFAIVDTAVADCSYWQLTQPKLCKLAKQGDAKSSRNERSNYSCEEHNERSRHSAIRHSHWAEQYCQKDCYPNIFGGQSCDQRRDGLITGISPARIKLFQTEIAAS
jgi:hypothetical protein